MDTSVPAATYQTVARDTAETFAAATLDRHRAAVRARLLTAGAVRADAGTVSWRVNREVIVIVGWARAILLLLAHPLIAAGVGDHSAFRRSLVTSFKRLWSTVSAMLSLTFGTDEEAIDAAARINSIHDRVSGRLGEPTGTLEAGERYSAHDPELLRWVHATLLDSILLTYDRLVGPLTMEERDRYCAEAAIMEPLLDIPAGLLPRDSAQLDAYVRETLDSRRIVVGARSRALARAILFPPGWRLMWLAFRPLQLLTIGLLPPAIREGYDFEWTPRDDRGLTRWTAVLRRLHGTLPPFIRQWRAARRRKGQTHQQRSHARSRWSAGPLEIGQHHPLHVREERLSTRDDGCRLVYVSDIHLRSGRSDTLCRQVVEAVARCHPDVVLLGGDLVDAPSELSRLSTWFASSARSHRCVRLAGTTICRSAWTACVTPSWMVAGNGSRMASRASRIARERSRSPALTQQRRSMEMSASCVRMTRESGRPRAIPATTLFWPATCTAVNSSPANIAIACFRARSFTPTAS